MELPLTVAWKQAPTLSCIPPKWDFVADKVRGRLASRFHQHDVAGFRFQAGVSVGIGLAFRNIALAQVAEMAEQPTKPGPTRIERSHSGLQEMRTKQY